jgi:DNA-binding IclR family transcriptional regulator
VTGAPKSNGVADAALKHRIPAIDRMMEVMTQLERRESGTSIRDLVAALNLPRTTVYRILNSLQLHDMVRRDESGMYLLGSRLLTLASHVATGASKVELVAVAQPFLEALADELGQSTKLSVVDGDMITVLGVASARREYALSVTPGQRQPLHAGASGKLLLAHMPEQKIDEILARPLVAYGPRTQTNPRRLRAECARIRRLGYAQDRGEVVPSVLAFAAPVFDTRGVVVAALSAPFLDGPDARRMEEIRVATIAAAKALSAAIPGPVSR